MQERNNKNLAERIAHLLEAESQLPDLSSIQTSIENLNKRLEKIEARLTTSDSDPKSTTFIPQSAHPSQQRFAVVEAIADEIFSNYQKEKACTLEPNGKPCDHCSMCSSRGF